METHTIKWLIFISLLLYLASAKNYAETTMAIETIGQVVWAKGKPNAAQPGAAPRLLARRSPIYAHDTLMTDTSSSGQILFTDNSIISLHQDTTFKIDQYQYRKNTHDTFVANIAKGGFRTMTGYISKNNPNGYAVTTPVATIGVSGTQYSVYYNPKDNKMAAKLEEGNIFITNGQGRITLTKCPPGTLSTRCIDHLYGEVNAQNIAPRVLAKQPAVFLNEPPIITTPVASTATLPTSGATNSFCIN